MNRFPWQPAYAHSFSTGNDDQIEALQTDVMRFIAILGLCLMAIFSIVQSLPYQRSANTPKLESKELLQTETQQLQGNISELLAKIKQLDSVIQHKQQVKQTLEQLNQAAELQRGELSELNHKLQQEKKALTQVQHSLAKEQRTDRQDKIKLEKITVPSPTAKQKTKNKSFSLRFASDQTLLNLIQQQTVNLYLLMGKNAWKINSQSGNWQIKNTRLPIKYYQMAVQTVPAVLKQIAKKKLSVHEQSQIVWAIELPQSITTSITRLIKNQQPGDLVINQNGYVQLTQEGI